MNKDRQHIERDIEHVTVLTMNTIKLSLSVECHIFATTSIWRLSDIQRFPMRSILNQFYSYRHIK